MARGFKSTPRGFVAELNRPERRLLRTLFNDVIELLDTGETVHPVSSRGGGGADRTSPAETEPAGTEAGTAEDADEAFWSIVGDWDPAGPDAQGRLPDLDQEEPTRSAPEDPALARLLPSGVRDDDQAAGVFRAATEDAVRAAKTADLQRAAASLQSSLIVLDEPGAVGFSRALNDVRLVLSARLDIQDEEDAARVHEIDDWAMAQDVESYMALLYNFTTWLQETLMLALTSRLPD